MPRCEAVKYIVFDTEDLGDPLQVSELGSMDGTVGGSNNKQAIEYILQLLAIVAIKRSHTSGIDLGSGNVALGQIEDARQVPLVVRRHGKMPPDSIDFNCTDDAVGLGHFRG